MKLCLKCFALWPGDALFCGRCRKALGAKRCPNGHANPLYTPALSCLICNEGPLDGVPYLSLGGTAALVALLIVLVLWRWIRRHPVWVLGTLWRAGIWAAGVVFDESPGCVRMAVRQILGWYVALWLLSYLLPRNAGRPLRQTLSRLPRTLRRALGTLWRWLRTVLTPASGGARGEARPKDHGNGPH